MCVRVRACVVMGYLRMPLTNPIPIPSSLPFPFPPSPVAAKRHGVILPLLGIPPPLARAPKHRLVTLGNVKVSDEHLTRDRMRDHAERTVALLMVGVTPYARTRNNTIQ